MGGQMRTGRDGIFGIPWRQTEVDGLEAAPLSELSVGSAWSWRGQVVRMTAVAMSDYEQAEIGGTAVVPGVHALAPVWERPQGASAMLVFSNGAQSFQADLVRSDADDTLVLIFEDGFPTRDQEFWVSQVTNLEALTKTGEDQGGTVVSFPKTRAPAVAETASLPRYAAFAAE